MTISYAVVDGSNIATEGRSLPSLAQLDEAVRQFQDEFPDLEVIVVVDATFGHRIDPAERDEYDEAVAHGELVSPPAGAIGRGDAFLLRVAERVGAQVLSNDSFQEFHGEHPWLFDEGRLIGGKPIPGVGWIFTPRSPVRGPKSRAATGAARRSRRAAVPAEPEAWEPSSTRPQVGDRRRRRPGAHTAEAVQAVASAVAEAEAAAAESVESVQPREVERRAAEPQAAAPSARPVPQEREVPAAQEGPEGAEVEVPAPRRRRAAKALGAIKSITAPRARRKAAGPAAGEPAAEGVAPGRRRGAKSEVSAQAAAGEPAAEGGEGVAPGRRRGAGREVAAQAAAGEPAAEGVAPGRRRGARREVSAQAAAGEPEHGAAEAAAATPARPVKPAKKTGAPAAADPVEAPAGRARGRAAQTAKVVKGVPAQAVKGAPAPEPEHGAAEAVAEAAAATPAKPAKAAKRTRAAKATRMVEPATPEEGEAEGAVEAASPAKRARRVGAAKAPKAAGGAGEPTGTRRVAKVPGTVPGTVRAEGVEAGATGATAGAAASPEAAKPAKAAKPTKAAKPANTARPAKAATGKEKAPRAGAGPGGSVGADGGEAAPARAGGRRRRRGGGSAEPVNDPLTFLTFITEHPLGSLVEGTVAAFVSHGAMVDVNGTRCYVPLRGLGDPPPQKARQVLERDQRRRFEVVALDPPRRGVELALPAAERHRADGPPAHAPGR